MTSATAYQATAPDAPLEKATIERRAVGPHDILIDVKFAGICHSDIHTARNEWGGTTYPVVPGHEIAGIVAEVGSEVTTRKVGDRVGVGCFVDSCGKCEACLDGDEQYCTKGVVQTYNSTTYEGEFTNGGYSTQIVVTEKFVLGIPEGVELDVAAPLLCAGITLYSPLKHWGAGPDKKVAIIGMGGLGHIGVKIAHAMGAHVTVLSQTDAKEADGKAYGADEYYATKDTTALKDLQGKFDLILNTVSANLPMGKYLGLLARNGTLVEPRCSREAPRGACIQPAGQPSLVRRFHGRRHCRDPGNAGLLRRAPHRCRDRGHSGREDQRGIRPRRQVRRALPLRDRRSHAVTVSLDA